MIWKISLFCHVSESECIEELCKQDLISECIKYLNNDSNFKITKLTAMRSIEFVINAYPIKISESAFAKLVSDGLLIVLNKVMKSKSCCRYVKSSCISILSSINKDFMKIKCLLKYQVLKIAYKDLKVTGIYNPHYNELISLICDSIILANECIQQVFNHYDNDFITVMFKFLICKQTNDGNIKRISCMFRIISETINKIEIECKNVL